MKKMNLEISYHREYKYYVYVSRDIRLSFPNKTKAEKFIRTYKRVLRDTVTQLHTLNTNIYNLFSVFYLQLDPITTHRVRNLLHNFDNRFEYVFKTYSHGNSCFSVTAVWSCFDTLEDVLVELKEYSSKNKLTSLRQQTRSYIKLRETLVRTFNADCSDLNISEKYLKKVKKKVLKLNKTA